MFDSCSSLKNISMWNTQTTKLEKILKLFNGCSSLTSVDLSSFRTSNVEDFSFVFNSCSNLISCDLTTFSASNFKFMKYMFNECTNLKNISFWNTATSNLEDIYKLFYKCSSLTSLDLSSFVTTKINDFSELFYCCSSLTSLDLSNLDTSIVTTMKSMFYNCLDLKRVDLSNFNTEKLTDMSYMFYSCSNLESLSIPHFKTSEVKTMNSMLYNCNNLIDVNFGNIDTSSVEDMAYLFQQCSSIKSLDLSNFKTSNVRNRRLMFFRCDSLESLDVSNFDTSNVNDMESMFFECKNLKYLNLLNFKTTNIATVKNMFSGSSSLKYLNLYLFDIGNPVDKENIFNGLKDDVIYYIQDADTIDYILPTEKHRYVFCSDECYFLDNNFKIDFDAKKCLDSCTNSENNKLEYNNVCCNTCPSNTLIYNNLCIHNFCDKYEEYSIECIDGNPLGYYLDSDGVYKKCFALCKSCNGVGTTTNHNCEECISNYRFLNDFDNDKNCYPDCGTYNYYFDESNVYHCTENEACPTPYDKLIPQKKKCIDQCEKDNTYKFEYHHTCLDHLVTQTTKVDNNHESTYIDKIITEKNTIINEETHIKTEIISNEGLYDCFNQNKLINKCFINDNYNNSVKYNIITSNILSTYSASNLKSLVFEGENGIRYQITNSKNEFNLLTNGNLPDNYNLPIIDLGECETLLRGQYNIDEKDSLIIIKKENVANKTSEKNIEYEIFEPYNKTKLNLSICSEVDINMYVQLELSDETIQLA